MSVMQFSKGQLGIKFKTFSKVQLCFSFIDGHCFICLFFLNKNLRRMTAGYEYLNVEYMCSILLVTRTWVFGSMNHLQKTIYVKLSEELLGILLRRYGFSFLGVATLFVNHDLTCWWRTTKKILRKKIQFILIISIQCSLNA